MPPSHQKIKQATSFAAEKHSWIEHIARDPRVSHLQVRVALLISFHLNKVSRDAWPSQDMLAAAMGVTRRAVQLNLQALAGLGYLLIEAGGMGPGDTNHYSPVLEDDGRGNAPATPEKGEFALKEQEGRIPVHEKGESHAKKGESPFAQTLLREPSLREPVSPSA